MDDQKPKDDEGTQPPAEKPNTWFEKNKHQTFPCYRYHRKNGTRLFTNLAELVDAGPGWETSPKAAGITV